MAVLEFDNVSIRDVFRTAIRVMIAAIVTTTLFVGPFLLGAFMAFGLYQSRSTNLTSAFEVEVPPVSSWISPQSLEDSAAVIGGGNADN